MTVVFPITLANARRLRRNMTDAERKLWYLLRAKRFAGYKFRRQEPFGKFVLDFVCYDMRLVIELDGGQHAEEKQKSHDAARTAFLASEGFRVVRFWNDDVLIRTDSVLETLLLLLPPRGGAGEAECVARRSSREGVH